MDRALTLYRRLVLLALGLTACVVVFGAYVRLSDAGLGCPDWPGCYGKLSPAHAAAEILDAHEAVPHGPVSLPKAWKEMTHRYLAASLGLLIIAIAFSPGGCVPRRRYPHGGGQPASGGGVPGAAGQMDSHPVVETGHRHRPPAGRHDNAGLAWLALRAMVARLQAGVSVASRLGCAWRRLGLAAVRTDRFGRLTSTNYAALACTDFPPAGSLWPRADYGNAFHVVRELGMTADGELLSNAALTAIHWAHRIGAVVVGTVLLALGFTLAGRTGTERLGLALAAALLLQVSLGAANVWLSLPLGLAAAHNAGAVLLLALMVSINYRLAGAPERARHGLAIVTV